MKRKTKVLGGRKYLVLGSTIDYGRGIGDVVKKSYTTTEGKVTIEKGIVNHPDGSTSREY